MSKRILDLNTISSASNDDYLVVDGSSGTRKITPENIVSNSTVAQTLTNDISNVSDDIGEIQSTVASLQNAVENMPLVDATLSESGQAADAKVVGDEIIDIKADLNQAIEDFAVPTQEAVDNWLSEHPEATTTVLDGTITEAKLADEAVTNDKLSPDIQKPWYLLKDINMFGQITTVQFPVKKSYVEDITYDTRRNRFYLGVCDYSGGDYNAEIVVVDGDTFSVIHTYYYTFGTIGTLSYNPKTDQIYVALTGGNYRLYSIDAETMESQGELTTETFSVGVQYDIEQEINVALQLSGTTAEIRTYDDDFDLLNTYIIAIEATDTPQQGFAVKNGIVYVPTWNSILEIDYKNNRLNRIGIAKVQRGNDEAEGLCFKNSTLYSASFISGSEGSCAIYKYGFSSGLNFVTARFYNVNSFNTSAVIESYATLFEYIVNGMKANDIAFIYRYGASFSDLPNLYDGNAYITEIYVVKTSPSIEYTQIELCMHQIDETRTNMKRWRGIIKKSSSTAITWIPYGMNPYGKGTTIFGGSDLDDYVIPGVYAIEASSTAQNIAHMPVAAAGRLEVRESIQDGTGLYIIQTFYRTNSVDAEIYHRVKTTDSTGFGTWKKVAYAT